MEDKTNDWLKMKEIYETSAILTPLETSEKARQAAALKIFKFIAQFGVIMLHPKKEALERLLQNRTQRWPSK